MTEKEIVEFLDWLEQVFPDKIKFGNKHIPGWEAKQKLAKSYIEIRR